MTEITVHHGDCREVLASLPDCSVDSVVTDPPYELGFMGKSWDASGIAYQVDLWREVLRVLKPGGHLLAFGGTRTYHRMAVAIEDAGFEVRDSIHWIYGSGFPKSLDVSKAIDKRGGNVAGFEQFRDAVKDAMKRNGVSRAALTEALGNHMLSHYLTAGSQPAVPNTDDYRIIRDTVGLGSTWDDLFLPEADREVIGKRTDGATRIYDMGEGPRLPPEVPITVPATDAAKQWEGWGTALKPAHEPIVLARKPLTGTVAANVLEHGTGALNIDGCRVDMGGEYDPTKVQRQQHSAGAIEGAFGAASLIGKEIPTYKPAGRWPANVIFDTEAGAVLDEQSDASRFFTAIDWDPDIDTSFRYVPKPSKKERNAGLDGLDVPEYSGVGVRGHSPEPYAVRTHNPDPEVIAAYLKRAREVAGFSKSAADAAIGGTTLYSWYEGRPKGTQLPTPEMWLKLKALFRFDDTHDAEMTSTHLVEKSGFQNSQPAANHHPTVKPLALMRWLVRLITPPGGTVLDPFAGSGTTLMACVLEGFHGIGIEMTDEYLPIIDGRVQWAREEAQREAEAKASESEQESLF